ncbi:hypothetical protein [Amphibacillus jilinensis]|uniref:hypothetical protein n=1 Tax=Amphibacillus jilinensis TaxID=1216008 RepID=UPI00031946EF|nr:hypothetical protein [Amphibacillus jilinensis]
MANEIYENYLSEDFEMLNRSINTMHSLSIMTIDKLLSGSAEDMREAELAAYNILHHVEVVKALRTKKIKRDLEASFQINTGVRRDRFEH